MKVWLGWITCIALSLLWLTADPKVSALYTASALVILAVGFREDSHDQR